MFALLSNANNAVPAAAVTASAVRPATRTVFPQPTARHGNGQVIVSGGYGGANDAEIEIEIRPPSGTGVRVSQPLFAGAGNGTMEQPTANPGTASQEITVTLADLGTQTTHAQAVLYGDILLRAKAPGAAGNAIQLTVKPALTLSAQPLGALSAALNADTQEWTDLRHDFGAVALLPDGTIPDTAPRMALGRDLSRVYRHYKRWDGDQWRYGISPKCPIGAAESTAVFSVSGTYTVTVTDGVTTETYPSLITLYDFLTALSTSTLTEPVGVLANDRKPGGMAAMDVPIRTTAFLLPVRSSDPERLPGLQNLAVAEVAPSETVIVECVEAAPIGSERWKVTSVVSGVLPDARTGEVYRAPYMQFAIPAQGVGSDPITGHMAITGQKFAQNPGPSVCLYRPVLGAKAKNQTLTLTWKQRPSTDGCDCRQAPMRGRPSAECLGVAVPGDTAMANLDPEYQSRLQVFYTWLSGLFGANTGINAGRVYGVQDEAVLFYRVESIFMDGLSTLFSEDSVPAALTAWDAKFSAMQTDLTSIATQAGFDADGWPTGAKIWKNGTTLAVGDYVKTDRADVVPVAWKVTETLKRTDQAVAVATYNVPVLIANPSPIGGSETDPDGQVVSGNTASDDWPLSITDEFIRCGADAEYSYYVQLKVIPPSSQLTASEDEIDAFVRRYEAGMKEVLAIAGILPKSNASTQGGGCWRDPGDVGYWEVNGGESPPVFNSVYYHAVKYGCGSGTFGMPGGGGAGGVGGEGITVEPTYEYGFGLKVACPERLRYGDTITITINDVSINYPYRVGDRYVIPTVSGGPLTLAGGITGTDTLTWRVESSAQTLPDYPLTLAELAYSAGGLSFTIQRGKLAFALGDQFRFAVETGGRWRWRKDGGAWSADAEITDSAALAEGLTAAFVSGAAPSFESGDVYRYTVRQPHSPGHVRSAHGESWHWSGATATLTLIFPTDQPVSVLGLLRHTLRAPASVTVTLWDAADSLLYSVTPPLQPGPLLDVLPAQILARKLTVAISNAEGMALGWLYAGVPFSTRHQPSITLQRHWAMERGSERNPRGAYLGRGASGEIRWENWLMQKEFEDLLALIDASKQDADAPLVLLPNVKIPGEAALVRVDSDALELSDVFDFQPNPNQNRRLLSLTLPLAPVLI